MYKNILLPTDGSELSNRAVRHGIKLAKALKARVIGMTNTPVWQDIYAGAGARMMSVDDYERETKATAGRALATIKRLADKERVRCATVHARRPDAWKAIIRTARGKGCDLIVMASHGRSGMKAFVLGSETNKVLAHTKIPVLVHR
ncbi:MAG: universal stress protein [Alphaproteobacteria bacterium]|nr:universal stress protein [Alphaproteobacteria bacterium]